MSILSVKINEITIVSIVPIILQEKVLKICLKKELLIPNLNQILSCIK